MSKISFALVALLAIVAAMAAAPFTPARAQSAARIEYARVTPYQTAVRTGFNAVQMRSGYRACVATVDDWACRDFAAADVSSASLRLALATLGNEGWELVSAVNEDTSAITPLGVSYLFKRQVR